MYIKQLIKALHPFGDVLSVGYGPWLEEIQAYHPRTHTVISTDKRAIHWAKEYANVKVFEDVWQEVLASLGVFDTIFFASFQVELAYRMRYTDTVLDAFCKSVKNKEALAKFLTELVENGQISNEQKKSVTQKYDLKDLASPSLSAPFEMLPFLEICLQSHMRKGSRFSCYLKNALDDAAFFDKIIVNPEVYYKEEGRIIIVEKM